MAEFKRLRAEDCVDMDSECLYDYVYAANDRYNPHCHDFYEIFVTISGTVTHRVNGVTQKLGEGTLVFIRPDDVHAYIYDSPESENTSYVNLTFTRGTVSALKEYLAEPNIIEKLLNSDMPPLVRLSRTETELLLSRIGELNSVNWQDKKALKVHMRAILADIIVKYLLSYADRMQTPAPSWLVRTVSLMERKENFSLGIDAMVNISGKSREHIARCIKKHYGVTATEFVNGIRVNYAANLLAHTNTPVLEICFECGFGSVSSFYTVFKEKYGVSPMKIRKNKGQTS